MSAPPAFEFEVSLGLGIHLRVDVVLLGPQCVRRILALEVLHQPGAVELAGSEIAGQRGEPASSQQAARIAHRVFAVHAGPIGKRRAGDDDGSEQFRPQRCQDHDGPAGLAIADHARLAVGLRMAADDLLDEQRFGARDALDRLSGHRLRQEADEIAGMTCFHRDADFAVRLEPADSRAMPGARIDHDERPPVHIDFDVLGWNDAHQRIIDRLIQLATVDDQFGGILQDVRCRLSDLFPVLVAAPAHDVQEQDAPLPRIHHVFYRRSDEARHGAARQRCFVHRHVSSSLSPSLKEPRPGER